MLKNIFKNRLSPAFTLLELTIYIALATLTLMMIITIGHNLIISNARSEAQRELSVNMRSLVQQISQSIKNATNVTVGSSTFGSHPGVLTLDYPGSGTDVIINTYDKTVTMSSGATVAIKKLRIKEGTLDYQDLTSDNVNVTNFVVRNLTRGSERKNINLEVTLSQLNPAGDPNYDASLTTETATSLRQ